MIYTLALTVLIALLGAVLSTFSLRGERTAAEHPVFAEERPLRLSDDNLVDALKQLSLSVPIAKVGWDGSILSIDLKVIDDNMTATDLYKNMAEFIAFSFGHTTNVDQLLIRLLAEDKWLGTRYLLLASDVRRGEWPLTALQQLKATHQEELSHDIVAWFRITETSLWRSRFGVQSIR